MINVYKEKGYTSHDAVAILRKTLNTKKVGHAGTLDPLAEGVLIILVGKATKLSNYLMAENKEYRAEITFGAVTDTYDGAGEIIRTGIPSFDLRELKRAVSAFTGTQNQVPPMYSAIKSEGKKLYTLARKGIEIERSGREITIDDIEVESFNGRDKAIIYVKCQKGTYIRSLCYDIGEALGCGAYMSALVRTKSGSFDYRDGARLSYIKEAKDKNKLLISLDEALCNFHKIIVREDASKLLYNGGKIPGEFLIEKEKTKDALAAVYDERGRLAGIYEIIRDSGKIQHLRPKTMLCE